MPIQITCLETTKTFLDTMDIITIVTSIATLAALGFTIYQASLAKKALLETKKSIDQEKVNRQISLLPKFQWIIQVEVELKMWQEELEEMSKKLTEAVTNKNETILKEFPHSRIKKPSDLHLSEYQYKEMPNWLSQLWISGAQYYYSGLGSSEYLYKDNKPDYFFAEMLIKRCGESSRAIALLRGYISDMIPEVILETPASVSTSEFFKDGS